MKEPREVLVPLTHGFYTLIDSIDVNRVCDHFWSVTQRKGKTRYAHGYLYGCTTPLHRFILRAPEHLYVDHINGNGLDNRRCNLRLITQSNNIAYSVREKHGKIEFTGVLLNSNDTYLSQITHKGRRWRLGTYLTANEAARAYDCAARLLFGEFARPNFPNINLLPKNKAFFKAAAEWKRLGLI